VRFWIRVRLGFATVSSRRLGLDAVDAGDADDLLDQIRLAFDVRTPGRSRDADALARALEAESELLQDLL
jgi:hypothetical protein